MNTIPIITMVTPFVQTLREDTNVIISVNPSRVNIMREVFTYDDYDDEIISVDHKIVGSELVRISEMQVSPPQSLKINDATLQYYKSYHLTARFDADIKKGDILIREDEERFIVQDIRTLYAEGFSKNNCYRKAGTLCMLEE